MASDSDPTKNLLDTLVESDQLQRSLREQFQQGLRRTQSAMDHTRIAHDLAAGDLIDRSEAQRLDSAYRSFNDSARTLNRELRESLQLYTASANTSVAVTTAALGDLVFRGSAVGPGSAPLLTTTRKAFQQLAVLAARDDTITRVTAELQRCGLDRPCGDPRSPLDLLSESQRALDVPTGAETSPIAVLIPLRSCIDRVVLDLFERCLGEDRSSDTWKARVLSIGRRCGIAGAPAGTFERLAETLTEKIKRPLSSVKDLAMPRDELLVLVAEGVSFLIALLSAVDERRLTNRAAGPRPSAI